MNVLVINFLQFLSYLILCRLVVLGLKLSSLLCVKAVQPQSVRRWHNRKWTNKPRHLLVFYSLTLTQQAFLCTSCSSVYVWGCQTDRGTGSFQGKQPDRMFVCSCWHSSACALVASSAHDVEVCLEHVTSRILDWPGRSGSWSRRGCSGCRRWGRCPGWTPCCKLQEPDLRDKKTNK